MISIKRYLESDREGVLNSAVASYRAVVSAIGCNAEKACPPIGVTLQDGLAAALQHLTGDLSPPQIVETHALVEKELDSWGCRAGDDYQQRNEALKELLLEMAATAESLGQRDTQYGKQLSDFSNRLTRMADLKDLPQLRSSLLDGASELKNCVQKMSLEGQEMVSQLQGEVRKYRERIEEVERSALLDALTGLVNRRGLELAIEYRLAQRRPFCLMLLDLNGFKKINDRYGHLAGDHLLKQFSGELRRVFRATDHVGRWGGDEFVVALDGPLAMTGDYVERVRRWSFGEYVIESPAGNQKVFVDAAIGMTEWQPDDNMATMLARADKEMYSKK